MSKEDLKFFSLMSDTTFKYLFKNPKTRFFFDKLIYYYTGLDISSFTLIDNELSSGNKYVSYRIDTLLVNKDKDIILNVELNREHEEYTELRNRRYLHTIAGTSKDSTYTDKRKVIQLNFNNFNSTYRKDISRETFQLHDIENDIIIDDFIIHNVFLSKERDICYNESIRSMIELFLCNSYEEMEIVVEKNKELKIIMSEIERLNQDEYFGGLYNIEEEQRKMEDAARRYGFEEGRDIGLQEGRIIERNDLVLNLLNENIDINTISRVTGLSIKEIEELRKNL